MRVPHTQKLLLICCLWKNYHQPPHVFLIFEIIRIFKKGLSLFLRWYPFVSRSNWVVFSIFAHCVVILRYIIPVLYICFQRNQYQQMSDIMYKSFIAEPVTPEVSLPMLESRPRTKATGYDCGAENWLHHTGKCFNNQKMTKLYTYTRTYQLTNICICTNMCCHSAIFVDRNKRTSTLFFNILLYVHIPKFYDYT